MQQPLIAQYFFLAPIFPVSSIHKFTMHSFPSFMLISLLCLLSFSSFVFGQHANHNQIVDASLAPVAGASITVQSPTGVTLITISTNNDGTFTLTNLPDGVFTLTVGANGFQTRQLPVNIRGGHSDLATIQLSINAMRENITVTANRGATELVERSANIVSIKDEESLRARPLATIGNALEGAPGILVQQSTYGQVSPFMRGLTGYQVLNLVDGVRFNNATFRQGPNQYLAFIEPSQAQRVEALLGPTGVQYGSDALGGTINVLTSMPSFCQVFQRRMAIVWRERRRQWRQSGKAHFCYKTCCVALWRFVAKA